MRQGFDASQPREHRSVLADGNTALGCMPDIGITGEVGDGGVFGRQKIPRFQMLVHEWQEHGGDLLRLREVARKIPLEYHARKCRTVPDLPGCDRKPALYLRGRDRLLRQPPAARRIAFGQIDQDGVAVRERQIAILQHGDLAQRVQLR